MRRPLFIWNMKRFSKSSVNSPKRSPRQLRMGEEIRHALAAELQRGDFPWDGPRPMITVTEVRISPDLSNATAYIVPMGGVNANDVEKQLNVHVHHFKNVIAHEVIIRRIPQLHFTTDTSFEYADKIERILHDPAVARDLKHDDGDDD
jgi:ribosome-binding factor A